MKPVGRDVTIKQMNDIERLTLSPPAVLAVGF